MMNTVTQKHRDAASLLKDAIQKMIGERGHLKESWEPKCAQFLADHFPSRPSTLTEEQEIRLYHLKATTRNGSAATRTYKDDWEFLYDIIDTLQSQLSAKEEE